MSMTGMFRRLPPRDLERLLAEPSLILDYLDAEGELDGFGPFADLDIDKAWHGIHFLLTGTAWDGEPPLNFIVAGGSQIGDEDAGYGPARGFNSAEVREISVALGPVTEAALTARFDPKAMHEADIYPDIWTRDPSEDDPAGYLLGYFADLQAFISGATQEDEALLVFLT